MAQNENADAANAGASENSHQNQVDYTSTSKGSQPRSFDDTIIERLYTGLGPTLRACLAVCGAMSLKGRARPLSLILEGTSGSGKTAVVQMLVPKADRQLNDYIYRSDDFTARSFVSHAASVSKEELATIDLLPRLRNKVLLTKELAPIFSGNEDKLTERIAMLISVLDGEGFISDSGMRGRRGYEEPIMFNWIGATTPLSPKTHRIMAQLGTRFLFWEVPAIELTEGELLDYARNGKSDESAAQCNALVNNFLCEFFSRHPVGSVDPETIIFPEPLLEELTRWARLLVTGRAVIHSESDLGDYSVPVSAALPEGPWRVVDYFKDLVRGHALISGRTEVIDEDIALVAHIAVSSLPLHFRPMLQGLRKVESVTSAECEGLCRVSRPTARKILHKLELLGIVDRTEGSAESNQPDTVRLAEAFRWLRQP